MTTTTLPADLSGLTIVHARRLERESRKRKQLTVSIKRGFRGRAMASFFWAFLTGRSAEFIDRVTGAMADQAVWFHGVRAAIEDGAKLTDPTDVLVAELEKAQMALGEFRASLLDAEASVQKIAEASRRPLKSAQSIHRLLATLADVHAAVESARWAILEREADDDIAAGRVGKTYTSAEDLIASLRA